jgi:SAM-dependent methyltransferase
VSDRDTHRLSFGRVVEAYERSRPLYAPDAVAWIARRFPFRDVLDLGAGTGKLTRQLVPLAQTVVAVEPDDEMRAMLERVVPGVDVRAGSAEAIPADDASVDVVTVAQAFHWFDTDAALAEMHRVLRTGGGFAIVFNRWDFPELNAIVDRLRTRGPWEDAIYDRLRASPLFAGFDELEFRHADVVDVETILERVGSVSAVINAAEADRAAAFDEIRARFGDGPVEFPLTTSVIAADRV